MTQKLLPVSPLLPFVLFYLLLTKTIQFKAERLAMREREMDDTKRVVENLLDSRYLKDRESHLISELAKPKILSEKERETVSDGTV